jgi:hypothetical protein
MENAMFMFMLLLESMVWSTFIWRGDVVGVALSSSMLSISKGSASGG